MKGRSKVGKRRATTTAASSYSSSDEEDEIVVRKGPWKAEEDEALLKHVNKYGPRDWSSLLSKRLLRRTGKSCRLRWVYNLRPNLKSGGKRSRDTTDDGEEQQSPIRPIGLDATKCNRGKKVAKKMDDEFEDCSARESESGGSFEQMTALQIKQIELDMAKTAQKRDDKRMEVLMTLLNKQTLMPTEEETKERLLKLL